MTDRIEIVEVGPRDGLQNEPGAIPVARKVALIDLLAEAGFARIEAASFVSPGRVPQMAGSGEVMARIARRVGTSYGALTPNMRGLTDAIAARVDWVAVFASASEGFSRANLGAGREDAMARFAEVAAAAEEAGLPVRGYVSCITHCPYDGATDPGDVVRAAMSLFAMGCHEVALGDTLGRATPREIATVLDAVMAEADAARIAGHFHDTGGRALDNVATAMERGLRIFDASIAGLGGCPFAPGAAGNLATGALADWADGHGLAHGLDRSTLARAETLARDIVQGTADA